MSKLVDAPADLLADLLSGRDEPPHLIIISGPSGSGKTTCCLQLVAQARAAHLRAGGLISPPVYHNGRKTGIDLVDQSLGACRRLAVRRGADQAGIEMSNWLIDPAVLAWGDQLLRDLPQCDILFIDELGPLEFARGEGLQAGLELIDKRQIPIIITVVRPSFLAQACARWPWATLLNLENAQEERAA